MNIHEFECEFPAIRNHTTMLSYLEEKVQAICSESQIPIRFTMFASDKNTIVKNVKNPEKIRKDHMFEQTVNFLGG